MKLLNSTFILLAFVLVRAADLAITYGMARSYLRAVFYGVVTVLALIAVALMLF